MLNKLVATLGSLLQKWFMRANPRSRVFTLNRNQNLRGSTDALQTALIRIDRGGRRGRA